MGALFETIGAILVGLVAIALAAFGLNTAFSSLRLSETTQGVITLRMQTQHLFSGTDYTGLTNDLAISSGIVPNGFIKGNKLVNSWGGDITLTPIPAEAAFSIELTSVPQSVCTKLARFQTDAWMRILVNGAEVSIDNIAEVAGACEGINNVVFVSR